MSQQDCVVTNDTQNKLLEYIEKRSSMIDYYEVEMLKKTVYNCNRKIYNHLFTDVAGASVTDEQIRKKADELVETIALEDIRDKLIKCDPQRVTEYLRIWLSVWTNTPKPTSEIKR